MIHHVQWGLRGPLLHNRGRSSQQRRTSLSLVVAGSSAARTVNFQQETHIQAASTPRISPDDCAGWPKSEDGWPCRRVASEPPLQRIRMEAIFWRADRRAEGSQRRVIRVHAVTCRWSCDGVFREATSQAAERAAFALNSNARAANYHLHHIGPSPCRQVGAVARACRFGPERANS